MAKLDEQVQLAIGVQVGGEGVPLPLVTDATTIVDKAAPGANEANGLRIVDGSLTFDLERIEVDGGKRAGTFTRLPGAFIRTEVSAFSFQIELKGGGQVTAGASGGEWSLVPAVTDLLAGAGIVEGTETATETNYAPGAISFLTFKVWRGDQAWNVQDCKVQLSTSLTPGETNVWDVTIEPGAVVYATTGPTFPTLDATYDASTQITLAPPVLSLANSRMGPTQARGFIDGTLTIGGEFSDFGDSNAASGVISERTTRSIEFAGNFYADDNDESQDWTHLIENAGGQERLIFIVGVAGEDPGNALEFTLKDVNYTLNSLQTQAGRIVWGVSGYATNDAADNEEFLIQAK